MDRRPSPAPTWSVTRLRVFLLVSFALAVQASVSRAPDSDPWLSVDAFDTVALSPVFRTHFVLSGSAPHTLVADVKQCNGSAFTGGGLLFSVSAGNTAVPLVLDSLQATHVFEPANMTAATDAIASMTFQSTAGVGGCAEVSVTAKNSSGDVEGRASVLVAINKPLGNATAVVSALTQSLSSMSPSTCCVNRVTHISTDKRATNYACAGIVDWVNVFGPQSTAVLQKVSTENHFMGVGTLGAGFVALFGSIQFVDHAKAPFDLLATTVDWGTGNAFGESAHVVTESDSVVTGLSARNWTTITQITYGSGDLAGALLNAHAFVGTLRAANDTELQLLFRFAAQGGVIVTGERFAVVGVDAATVKLTQHAGLAPRGSTGWGSLPSVLEMGTDFEPAFSYTPYTFNVRVTDCWRCCGPS